MGAPDGTIATFRHAGRRLAYSSYGEGPRTTVLLHGLLLNRRMHGPLAAALAERGNRVVTLDLLGHGGSEKPHDMTEYSITLFAEQVVALLDHLGAEEAVLGGTSLGANVTLEVAAAAPERLCGMVVEMPVLDNALLACALAFTPMMVAFTSAGPAFGAVRTATRLIPSRSLPLLPDLFVEWWQERDPRASNAVLQGLFFGRTAPPKAERRTLRTPALVIGHRRDPIHPFSDSDALVNELPDARLLEAGSILEMRVAPERLTNEIADFVDDCWRPRRARRSA